MLKELRYISTSFSSNNTFEKINDEFVKATISIMSCDQIANGTKFTKESVERASSTLNYAPVIGFFNGDDFEGHSIEYIVTDTEVKQIVKTVPFGVVIKEKFINPMAKSKIILWLIVIYGVDMKKL